MTRNRKLPLGAGLSLLAALGSPAAASAQTVTCPPPLQPWTEISLYFGRDIPGGGTVGEPEFRDFLDAVVTPRFPDGLTVLDVTGQYRYRDRNIVREPTKLVVIYTQDAAAGPKVDQIIVEYKSRFRQESVARDQEVNCVAFQ